MIVYKRNTEIQECKFFYDAIMKNIFILLVTVILLNSSSVFSQDNGEVRIWEEEIVLPSYPIHTPDKNPMFFLKNSYQGASAEIYPLPLINNLSSEKKEVSYKGLFLENEYIKLCVLPELGGKLFYATDKTNGYEIFYRQSVIKPANIGMTGAWISGGIEWCVFHHHRASTYMPMDYRLVENPDGSKTIWIGEIEPRHRMKWAIGISLSPGRSYIHTDLRMFNRTENPNSILYWANVATHASEEYQVFFPPSVKFGTYHAKNSFSHWPITREVYDEKDYYKNNIDASWWKNHPTPISFFAHNLQDDFLAGYDHGKEAGTIHVADHNVVNGAKLWQWGPGPAGANWDTIVLTDEDGPYIELMSGGFSDNQPDYSWIMPYETKQVIQYWYPLREIKGVKAANPNASANLLPPINNKVFIGLNTSKAYENAVVELQKNGEVIYTEKIKLSPSLPYSEEVIVPEGTDYYDLKLLVKETSGNELIQYKPEKKDENSELPETVKRPPAPSEINTNEELYLTGLRIKQFHNARIDAMDYFQEALKRDPLDVRCNVQVGLDQKLKGNYEKASHYFRNAVKRLTKDYTRPRDCEALYHLGVVLKILEKYDAAYDTLYRASWDQDFHAAAHYQMAEISTTNNDPEKALFHIKQSMSANTLNIKAMGLRTTVLRHMGDMNNASVSAEDLLNKDPLNYWAHFEMYSIADETGSANKEKLKEKLVSLLRDFPDSYLELATSYMNSGLYKDAEGLLHLALQSEDDFLRNYPMIHYYLGYLKEKAGNLKEASETYTHAASLSTDYCFPFRLESIPILESAINQNKDDYKAYYYQGNIMFDDRPEKAIEKWEKAVQINPDFAIAHRNLGWGYNHTYDNKLRAIREYEAAIKLNPEDARYYYELDKLYEENNADPEKRLEMLTKNHEHLSQREDALIREIMVLVLNRHYDKAINYLNENFFHIQEGSRGLHDVHVDAHLLRGLSYLEDGQYQKALDDFFMADKYPANHQIGRDPDYVRNAQIYYYTGLAYEKLGENDRAEVFYNKTVSQDIENSVYLYYQALAYEKLDESKNADELYNALISTGEDYIQDLDEVDFFAKFGSGESIRERQATGHYMIGLGKSGKGSRKEAVSHFEKTTELDKSRLWAEVHMENM